MIFAIRYCRAPRPALTYLALIAVPILAAAALGWAMRGSQAVGRAAGDADVRLAWAEPHDARRPGARDAAVGAQLRHARCPARERSRRRGWLKLGIIAMAAADIWLVRRRPAAGAQRNAGGGALARERAHLPQLQSELFGSISMGYGDLFVAALLGRGPGPREGRRQWPVALLTLVSRGRLRPAVLRRSTSCRRRCPSRSR